MCVCACVCECECVCVWSYLFSLLFNVDKLWVPMVHLLYNNIHTWSYRQRDRQTDRQTEGGEGGREGREGGRDTHWVVESNSFLRQVEG